ncbi:hypothetical protein CfE428DRAFT_1364 [Chthoniobacter flavus Ellin428]|uniref:Uncharacterized protein n=1 Tax=Chthoniobacter flavus Ellin428 TaxID=497964 RepID=B4CXS3_9BACT|nr:hypothetical protein [Chthoniobacter flavus]EDY21071.1 hypothetical protein CfE428DRAFT_1364 [Chthoniobacter flavus Ellin428]TCO88793.1 hypothetical protein EV701_116165 [Chthoniobacter flavus]
MKSLISAEAWNGQVRAVRRARVTPGQGCIIEQTPNGCILSGAGKIRWRHPWQVSAQWNVDPTIQPLGGQWTATLWPGFVNAQDVTIEVEVASKPNVQKQPVQVPLTEEDPPLLILSGFRDPAAPGLPQASDDGDIIIPPGEGYPKFFDSLGVVPASNGGTGLGALDSTPDPTRTRQIRGCDIALVTPRLATHQQVDVLDPGTDAQSVSISTVFDNTALINAKSAHWLIATSKWEPPMEPTDLDRLMGTAVEPQTDEIKIATVWLVSPPDVGSDAQPDETWTAYPQHFVFWNLNYASRAQISAAPPQPLKLVTGLALGVADTLINGLLSPLNDANAEVSAMLNAANFSGRYWSI